MKLDITAFTCGMRLFWSFDGLIGGAIFAWLYNRLTGRHSALQPRQQAVERRREK